MPPLVLLDRNRVLISHEIAVFPGKQVVPGEIRRVWIETRRPGLLVGGALTLLGVALLLRGVGLLRLVGAAALVFGILRSRVEQHVVAIQLDGGRRVDALATPDGVWAREVLAALERAREGTERSS